MKLSFLLAWFLGLCCNAQAADWYETLRPGITRSEILKLAGVPSESRELADTFQQQKGRIECTYDRGNLRKAIYYDAPGGAVSWTLYDTEGDPKKNDPGQRRAYLKAGNFSVVPDFSGVSIYTVKYPAIDRHRDRGACYELDGGFIVVEPIISLLGGYGFFEDKTARVLWLKPDGSETVLYRAADHWNALKPPGISENEVKKRQMKLRNAGDHIFKERLADVFEECDSRMGSGFDFRLFYLEDGLAIVSCDGETMETISIEKPGLTNLTLSEWLNIQSGASTNSAPPPR